VAEKTKKKIKFTVDWEVWNSYDHHEKWNDDKYLEEPTFYLLDLLRRHNIKAIFYCVGLLKYSVPYFKNICQDGHTIGDHTYHHKVGSHISKDLNVPFRAPRWKNEKRLFSGGFWFRLMPYWWIKREAEKEGIFFIHPHDVLLEHPKCGIRNFDRNIGLKTSRDKLERLIRELDWA
jgi:hypothetical protein